MSFIDQDPLSSASGVPGQDGIDGGDADFISPFNIGQTAHASLSGLLLGNDHPHYAQKDVLITQFSSVIAARVYNSAAIPISDSTLTTLTFNSERYDPGACHSTSVNTSRLTVSVTGKYYIFAHIAWAGSAAGFRQVRFYVNGVTIIVLEGHTGLAKNETQISTV